ncbi:MAG TPA: metallophosphoesterase, partial [Chroococcales cyanobacterium]
MKGRKRLFLIAFSLLSACTPLPVAKGKSATPAPLYSSAVQDPGISNRIPVPAPNDRPVTARGGVSKIERSKEGLYFAMVDPDQPFRILQLTDVHFSGNEEVNKRTRNLLATMISRFRPNLVAVTGDLIWTLSPAGTKGYLKEASKFMNDVCLQNNCQWAYAFGNHEGGTDGIFTNRDDLSLILSPYRIDQPNGCLLYEYLPDDPSKSQWGRFALEFVNRSTQLPLWDFYFLYSGDGQGTSISQEECIWMGGMSDAAKYRNQNQDVPAFAFFHIPLQQISDAWNVYESHGWKGSESSGEQDSAKVLEALKKNDVVATFSGHHHLNNYRTQWPLGNRNLYMYYGRYSGFGAPYKKTTNLVSDVCPSFQPGCMLIDVNWRERFWTSWEWDAKMGE